MLAKMVAWQPPSAASQPVPIGSRFIRVSLQPAIPRRVAPQQMAEAAVPRQMFQEILMLIARLRAPPASSMKALWGRKGRTYDGRGAPRRSRINQFESCEAGAPMISLQTRAAAIEFCCGDASIEEKSRPTDRESGKCRLMGGPPS